MYTYVHFPFLTPTRTVSGSQSENTKVKEYVGTSAASAAASAANSSPHGSTSRGSNSNSNSGGISSGIIGGAASNSFTAMVPQRSNNNLDLIDEQQRQSLSAAATATGTASGPFFDKMASKNVTALLGKTTYLNCRIKNLGNKTVSISKCQDTAPTQHNPGTRTFLVSCLI